MPDHDTDPTFSFQRLWTIADVAAFLAIEESELADTLADGVDVPQPLRIGRLVRWSPRDWLAWSDAAGIHSVEEVRPYDRLWSIGDVAAFLGMSENTANKVIDAELSATPPPVLDGRLRRWDPNAWWAWAAKRSDDTPKKSKGTPARPLGKATRV